jgi:snRNA-activating protein complex subunit 1
MEDVKHILQNDKLLGDKVEEIVKKWDAQKEEFYQKTGVSPYDELAVVGGNESGEFHDENEGFDELEQLLLE